MVGGQEYPVETTFKKVRPKKIQTFQNHKGYWTRSVSVWITREMGSTQHVQWRPANTMQKAPAQRIAYEDSTTIRHYK